MTHEEIEKKVMEKYPKDADEKRGCVTAIAFRNFLREEYRKKLKSNGKEEEKESSVST